MRVLVVDQGCAFAEALVQLLEQAGVEAAHATFETVASEADRFHPTLVLIDADAESERVLMAAGGVKTAEDVRVLLLTRGVHGDCEELAVRVGAAGWITRHVTTEELLRVLRRAHRATGPGVVEPARPRRDPTSRPAELSKLDWLSPRELEVLRHLMGGQRNDVLAETLGISPNTVRTHVQNILAKTGVRTRFEAVNLARRAGMHPAAALDRTGGAG